MSGGILRKLGFKKNWIYETIVTTCSGDCSCNSAPIGVWTKDYKTLCFRVYAGHKTLENLFENEFFIINFPDSIERFSESLFGRKPRYAKARYCCSISGLDYLEMKVISSNFFDDYVEFNAEVKKHKVRAGKIRLFNRGESLAFEYLIAKTKPKSKKRDGLLSDYRRTVKKVAPKSVYESIVVK